MSKNLVLSVLVALFCFSCAHIPATTQTITVNPNVISYHFLKTDFELVRSEETIILRTRIDKSRDPQFLRLRLEAELGAEILRLRIGAKENPPNINIIKGDLDGEIVGSEMYLTALSPDGYACINLAGVTVDEEPVLPLVARFFSK